MVNKLIQMGAIIKVNIRIMLEMEMDNFIIMMAVIMTVLGLMVNKQDMEFILFLMAINILVIGMKAYMMEPVNFKRQMVE